MLFGHVYGLFYGKSLTLTGRCLQERRKLSVKPNSLWFDATDLLLWNQVGHSTFPSFWRDEILSQVRFSLVRSIDIRNSLERSLCWQFFWNQNRDLDYMSVQPLRKLAGDPIQTAKRDNAEKLRRTRALFLTRERKKKRKKMRWGIETVSSVTCFSPTRIPVTYSNFHKHINIKWVKPTFSCCCCATYLMRCFMLSGTLVFFSQICPKLYRFLI